MKTLGLIIFLSLFQIITISAQDSLRWYLVQYKDKNGTGYSLSSPEKYLSQRAIERRQRYHIEIDSTDLPVSAKYILQLANTGVKIVHNSKWLNASLILVSDTYKLQNIKNLSCVKKIEYRGAKKPAKRKKIYESDYNFNNKVKSVLTANRYAYGSAEAQVYQCNGQVLHNNGYTGKDMWIAVLDGGFYGVDRFAVFDSLRNENRLGGYYDFVDPSESFFETESHGMSVLSVMAANAPGLLVGTAPAAKYWLMLCEDTNSEYPVEEDNWVCAAELSDSIGIDVISSSLGYGVFDDNSLSYKHEYMNGSYAHASIGASMAGAKGILVVVSAGNSRDEEFSQVGSPADAKNTLTIGAVKLNGEITYFSSAGPSADGRVKPDVSALGYNTALYRPNDTYGVGSGTSFASPVISGLAACLWQACRELSPAEIIHLIQYSSSQYTNPDSLYGFGIPNFEKALSQGCSAANLKNDSNKQILVYPTIFTDSFTLQFSNAIFKNGAIRVTDNQGREVFNQKITNELAQTVVLPAQKRLSSGIYIVNIISENKKNAIQYKIFHL
jgi:subtilisin family serine protease